MTEEMLNTARSNADLLGVSNVRFLKATIDSKLPYTHKNRQDLNQADIIGRADVVISNGVFNLTADKKQAFQLAFDMLKEGGRFQLVDVVSFDPEQQANKEEEVKLDDQFRESHISVKQTGCGNEDANGWAA
mmetsp:Transcript_28779/g.50617  ORF Transcript_28779/g.50617 Transcript_28779/m.50617 type:complete len:132 (-) Transcript_28779:523-918(-)